MKKIIMIVGFGLVISFVNVFAMRERKELDIEIPTEMIDELTVLKEMYQKLAELGERRETLKDLNQTPGIRARIKGLNKQSEKLEIETREQFSNWRIKFGPIMSDLSRTDFEFTDEDSEDMVASLAHDYPKLTSIINGTNRLKPSAMQVATVLGEVTNALFLVQKKMHTNIQSADNAQPGIVVDQVQLERYKRILRWALCGLGCCFGLMYVGNCMELWVMVVPTISIRDVIESGLDLL